MNAAKQRMQQSSNSKAITAPSRSRHREPIKHVEFELVQNFDESVDAYQPQDFSGAAICKYTEEEPDNIAKRYAEADQNTLSHNAHSNALHTLLR